jgi:leader peptidase (prepilin peptidase)/N-methyltransferase
VLTTTWGRATVVATGALWAGLAIAYGAVWSLPAFLVAGAGLVALTVIDLRQRLLPRRIVWPLFALTLALLALAAIVDGNGGALLRAVLSAGVAYAAFFALRLVNPAALGGGDVTLAAVLGLVLGWHSVDAVIAGLGLGAILAAVFAVLAFAARRVRADTALSYGPFLVAGALIILLANPSGRLL